MSRLVYVLNGPNLNLLGKRQPAHLRQRDAGRLEASCRTLAGELGLEIRFHQSNREYEIIDWIHEAARPPAGSSSTRRPSHTPRWRSSTRSNTFEAPVIEVHISNVHKREAFRHHSYVSLRADGVIAGLGTQGYGLALRRVAQLIDAKG